MTDSTRFQIRLFILVILAFLPAVGLYWEARVSLEQHEREQQRASLVELAELATVEYDQLLVEGQRFLSALAEFPEIRDGIQPDCDRRLAGVLRHTPQYTTLSLIDRDGYLACGSLTVDGDLYLGDRLYYLLATTNGQFSVGEYAIGRITGKPTVGVAYPIAEGDLRQVQRVLAASLDLSLLGPDRVGRRELPAYVTFTVMDRNGQVLVRSPAGRHPLGYDTVGAVAPETFPDLSQVREAAFISGTDLDGVDRQFYVAPLTGGRATVAGHVAVGIEDAMILSAVDESRRRNLRYLAIAGIGIAALTWLFGHYGLVRGLLARAARPT